ncbi:hypothetical protein DVH05_008065 [Phytophthora capsici]|nr:hypothetical protein DVH05_008065 [Phytophthora capsici]
MKLLIFYLRLAVASSNQRFLRFHNHQFSIFQLLKPRLKPFFHRVQDMFMNWAISHEAQTSVVFNSVRTDINANKPWDVPEANMAAFPTFMEDRAKVEQWKQTFALYFGEVQGEPSPGFLGLHPGQ